MNIVAPLFISSRLMAAIKIDGDTGGTIHVCHAGMVEYKQTYRWLVEDKEGNVLGEGTDLRTPEGTYTEVMETLIGFLEYAADVYRSDMGAGTHEDSTLFPPALMEWAYMNDAELSMARGLIDPDNWRTHLTNRHDTDTDANVDEMRAMHDEYHDNLDRNGGTNPHDRWDISE